MSRRKSVTLPIGIEFGPALAALKTAAGQEQFKQGLVASLAGLLAETGIPGTPQVSFHAAKSSRELSVKVHQARLIPSVELMQRIWLALAPADLHGLLDLSSPGEQPAGLDGWLVKYVAGLGEAQDAQGEQAWNLALRYLERLVVELLRQRPSALLGQAQSAEYLQTGFTQFPKYRWPGAENPDSLADILAFLQALLAQGISLAHPETILFVLNAGIQLGRTWQDSLESAFLRLRANRIEIHANPQDLPGVVEGAAETDLLPLNAGQVSQEFQESIRYLLEVLYTELGVRQPDVTLAISTENEPGVVAFKINDVLSPPVRLLRPDEALVNAALEAVTGLSIKARTWRVPVTGLGAAVASIEDQGVAQEHGLRTWNWLGYVTIALANELRQHAAWLVSLEDVEYQLAQLELDSPQLVYAVLELFSMEDVTRVLRGLAAENVPIRDLRAVYEAMLRYEAIPVDGGILQVMDTRLPVPNIDAVGLSQHWTQLLKFVRKEMRDQITDFITYGSNNLDVYLLGEQLEQRLHDLALSSSEPPAASRGITQSSDALLEAVRTCVSRLSPAAEWPVLVTGIDQRRFLRKLVELEFPRLRVAAFHDLAAGVQANIVDHIEIGE